ncbi:MAG: hypothetical protein ACO39T_05860 [Flavobacteriaceae bacterium]
MSLKNVLKLSSFLLIVVLTIASCNKDFHGVGASLLEDQIFRTQSVQLPVYAYQDAICHSPRMAT